MGVDIKETKNLAELFVRMYSRLKLYSLNQICEEIDITPAQFTAMRYLFQNHRNLLSDLATGLSISNAAVTKMTDRLEKKQLVKRISYAGDRRATALKLTPKGEEFVKKAAQSEIACMESVIKRMGKDDIDALIRGFNSFIQSGLDDIKDFNEVCLKCGVNHSDVCPLINRQF